MDNTEVMVGQKVYRLRFWLWHWSVETGTVMSETEKTYKVKRGSQIEVWRKAVALSEATARQQLGTWLRDQIKDLQERAAEFQDNLDRLEKR
jgi:hypothetical protein